MDYNKQADLLTLWTAQMHKLKRGPKCAREQADNYRATPPQVHLNRLQGELTELLNEILRKAPAVNVWREAGDVANFVMFLASSYTDHEAFFPEGEDDDRV
jgi:hypothetical protein